MESKRKYIMTLSKDYSIALDTILRVRICNFLKTKNLGGCDDTLMIYENPKSSTVYVVKWAVLGLQRTPENSVLAQSKGQ